MDVKKVQNYSENAKTVINLSERLPQYVKGLDIFLESLQKKKPEIYDDYLIALRNKLLSLILKPEVDLQAISIPNFQEELQKYNNLQKLYFTYIFQLLGVPENYSSETIQLLWSNYDRSSLYPFYYRCLILCEILERNRAIEFLKEYVDTINYEQNQPNLELEDLNYMWERDTREQENPRPMEFIAFRLHKGKVGGRVDRCSWHELMKPLNDPELSYIVACYGDTTGVQVENPNFVLTRTTTLIRGGPYCDNCIHDKRHISELEHPSNEFFKTLDSKC